MTLHQDPASILVEHLGYVDQVCRAICRRNGVGPDDAAEFVSSVRLHLVENDFSILRRFRGESSIRTYLAVVAAMCFRDFRVARWGRWRPSAEARRLGGVALRLEMLVVRDRRTLREAAEVLRSAGETDRTDGELAAIVRRLPRRTGRPLEVAGTVMEAIPSQITPERLAEQDEDEAQQQAAWRALEKALEQLPNEDRAVLRLRYWEGLPVADIARTLKIEQKPLYRRIEKALRLLRASLTAAGVSPATVREILA